MSFKKIAREEGAKNYKIKDGIIWEKEPDENFDTLVQGVLLERLSDLEHQQWAHWTKYMLDNMTDENIARWKKQIDTEYENLSDKEKESDREWARKVMNIMDEFKDNSDDEVVKLLKEVKNKLEDMDRDTKQKFEDLINIWQMKK